MLTAHKGHMGVTLQSPRGHTTITHTQAYTHTHTWSCGGHTRSFKGCFTVVLATLGHDSNVVKFSNFFKHVSKMLAKFLLRERGTHSQFLLQNRFVVTQCLCNENRGFVFHVKSGDPPV